MSFYRSSYILLYAIRRRYTNPLSTNNNNNDHQPIRSDLNAVLRVRRLSLAIGNKLHDAFRSVRRHPETVLYYQVDRS
jgi:hypothetical protein